MFRDRDYLTPGINYYVPGMQFAHELNEGAPKAFSLGTPAAADDDIITATLDGDATALTETTLSYTADSPYGRTLTMNPSGDPGAAGGVYDIYGFDYLGQPMRERFTGANGSTAVLYGKKAFKRVTKAVVVTAATNAITWDIGVGWRLGLPYKGDVVWAKEAGVLVPLYTRDVELSASWADADVTAGASQLVSAPCPGFIKSIRTSAFGGSTTNAAVTVELGGTAVVGLSATADQDAAPPAYVSDTPTTAGYNANNRVRTGDPIELVHAATTGGGTENTVVVITPTQFFPADTTDPATVSTGDPRGTYEPIGALGVEIFVALLGDNAVNTSDNGGLHGIRHYNG